MLFIVMQTPLMRYLIVPMHPRFRGLPYSCLNSSYYLKKRGVFYHKASLFVRLSLASVSQAFDV